MIVCTYRAVGFQRNADRRNTASIDGARRRLASRATLVERLRSVIVLRRAARRRFVVRTRTTTVGTAKFVVVVVVVVAVVAIAFAVVGRCARLLTLLIATSATFATRGSDGVGGALLVGRQRCEDAPKEDATQRQQHHALQRRACDRHVADNCWCGDDVV
jgi:hypothetical protein